MNIEEITIGELIRWLQRVEPCTVTTDAYAIDGTEIIFNGSTQTIAQCVNIAVICKWAEIHDKKIAIRCGLNKIIVQIL